MALPVFKTGLAGIMLAGEFDSLPPPPVHPLRGRCVRGIRDAVARWRRIAAARIVESSASTSTIVS